MKRLFALIILITCLSVYNSVGYAWTDDVEGMLMPSPRGEDDVSDPEAIMENIEGPADASSEAPAPAVEWE